MEFQDVVRQRRSVREFSDTDVPDELVKSLIDCALHAPSSMNGQPWQFIVVRSVEIKKRLTATKNMYCPAEKRDYSADFLQSAPVVIIICVDRKKSYDRGIENGVLATAHLLLAATDRGLASVYMSAYKSGTPEVADEIRAILGLPADIDPVTIVPIGYPGVEPGAKTVKTADEVMFHEAFGQK